MTGKTHPEMVLFGIDGALRFQLEKSHEAAKDYFGLTVRVKLIVVARVSLVCKIEA
jgi:hypothetical protein